MSDHKSDFITLLAKRANIDQNKAGQQLKAFVESIQSEVKEKGSFEIEKFGTFTLSDGQLTFSPHEQLEIEVNYKYAGMTPIQIRPAYVQKTKEASEQTQKAEDESKVKQQSAIDRLSQLASDSRKEKPADQKSEPQKPVSKSEEKKTNVFAQKSDANLETESTKKSEDAVTKEAVKPESKKGQPKTAQPLKKETTPSQSKPSDKKSSQEKAEPSKRNPLIFPIGIAATLLLAVLVFWLIQSGGPQVPESTVAQTETQPAPPETPEETVSETTSPQQDEISVPDPVITTQPYGLRGELSETTNYFTIVVMSLRSESNAISQKNSLISEGWRGTLHSVITTEGSNNFRVGIGQFETIAEAQDAARDLPEPYRNNNFISRVR